MNDENSTSTGGTATKSSSGASTPFAQIQDLELHEARRLQVELEGMENERLEVTKAITEKEEVAEQELKDAAREELKEYRETQLIGIISSAEKKAENGETNLETSYEKTEKQVTDSLLKKMLDSDSSILA
ncbi:MAG: hypothetical protein O2904_03245 [bacterium]|nr:hypothetical protein [bacterium]